MHRDQEILDYADGFVRRELGRVLGIILYQGSRIDELLNPPVYTYNPPAPSTPSNTSQSEGSNIIAWLILAILAVLVLKGLFK